MRNKNKTTKTCIALIISLMIYLFLMYLNKLLGFNEVPSYYVTKQWYVPTNLYTPFFAGIAVCYASQESYEHSKAQAKSRILGSIVGGYWGYLLISIFEGPLVKYLSLYKGTIPYNALMYILVTCGAGILMLFIKRTNIGHVEFISLLTYLSVTISVRNGGLGAFIYTNNRVLSTIIGVLLALYIHSFPHFKTENKNILFLCALDEVLYSRDIGVKPHNVHKIRDICNNELNLTYMSLYTADHFLKAIKPAEPSDPMIVMYGSAIYHPKTKKYSDIVTIENKDRILIDNLLKENNAFRFVYSEGDFICYYDDLSETGSRTYFDHNKEIDLKMVKAKVPEDLDISMYIIVNKNEVINDLYSNLKDHDELIITVSKYDLLEGYSMMIVHENDAGKHISLKKLKEYINFDYVVYVGSKDYDEDIFNHADYKVCLNNADKEILDKADYVISSADSQEVITFINNVYHSKDYKRYLDSLRNRG
ncbi:MAG: HAD hydrolase family protein [Erysipelotrichaceae bacterium]|nr:HAD hydrolase family protein [Erysipelotrichaceae bacterium]